MIEDVWLAMQSEAIRAIDYAYAPYSHKRVVAVLRTPTGQTFLGVNVENSSYSLTICAERSALFHAIAHGNDQFERILIHVNAEGEFAPCGACRHVLSEFSLTLKIGLSDSTRRINVHNLTHLLPLRTSVLEANNNE